MLNEMRSIEELNEYMNYYDKSLIETVRSYHMVLWYTLVVLLGGCG